MPVEAHCRRSELKKEVREWTHKRNQTQTEWIGNLLPRTPERSSRDFTRKFKIDGLLVIQNPSSQTRAVRTHPTATPRRPEPTLAEVSPRMFAGGVTEQRLVSGS